MASGSGILFRRRILFFFFRPFGLSARFALSEFLVLFALFARAGFFFFRAALLPPFSLPFSALVSAPRAPVDALALPAGGVLALRAATRGFRFVSPAVPDANAAPDVTVAGVALVF